MERVEEKISQRPATLMVPDLILGSSAGTGYGPVCTSTQDVRNLRKYDEQRTNHQLPVVTKTKTLTFQVQLLVFLSTIHHTISAHTYTQRRTREVEYIR